MPVIATGQNPSCQSCLAWEKFPNQAGEGSCHRNSPSPQQGALTGQHMHWPRTYANNWCLDWIPAPTVDAPEDSYGSKKG